MKEIQYFVDPSNQSLKLNYETPDIFKRKMSNNPMSTEIELDMFSVISG